MNELCCGNPKTMDNTSLFLLNPFKVFSPETSQKLRHLPVRKDRPRRSGCLVAPPKQSHTAPFPQRFQRLKVPGQGQGTMNWLGEIYWKRSSLPKKRGFQRIFPTNYGKPGWSINTPKHGVSLRASPGSWASFYHWMCIPVTTWFNQVLEPSYF